MKTCHNKHHQEDSLYCTFCKIVDSVLHIFDLDSCCNTDDAQNGELMVTAEGEILIPLKSNPAHIKIEFKDCQHNVPCNSNHFDELEWEVISHDGHDCNGGHDKHDKHDKHEHEHDHEPKFSLHIKWNVSDVRDVVWMVCY